MNQGQQVQSGHSPPHPTPEKQVERGEEQDGSQPNVTANFVQIDLIRLPEFQPRRYFNEEAMQQLTASVREHGILQPLLVRPVGESKYELVAGERRYKAAQAAGLSEVPVVVRAMTATEALEVALLENLQREDLNAIEETSGILQLLALNLGCDVELVPQLLYRLKHKADKSSHSQADAGQNVLPSPSEPSRAIGQNVLPNNDYLDADTSDPNILPNSSAQNADTALQNLLSNPQILLEKVKSVFDGLNRMSWESFVKSRLSLLNLPSDLLDAVRTSRIEYTKAQAMAKIKDKEQRLILLEQAIREEWSLSQIKERINSLRSGKSASVSNPLANRLDSTYKLIKTSLKKNQEIWQNPQTQERLSALLTELEALLKASS